MPNTSQSLCYLNSFQYAGRKIDSRKQRSIVKYIGAAGYASASGWSSLEPYRSHCVLIWAARLF